MTTQPNVVMSKIGVLEKREVAKLISEEFNELIRTTQNEMKYTEGEILKQAEKKFGLKCIEKQISQLKEQIEMLEKKRTQLGFTNNYNGTASGFVTHWGNNNVQEIDPNTQAGRFFYLKMARNMDIQAIKTQRDSKLKALWLTESRADIVTLANEKPKLQLVKK